LPDEYDYQGFKYSPPAKTPEVEKPSNMDQH